MDINCSGYPKLTKCSNPVPFVVEKQNITFKLGAGGSNLSLDLAKVVGEISLVLPSNAQVSKYIGTLDIYSLCEACWGQASVVWAAASQETASPQNASDYATAAAKATAQGLFFHVNESSFGDTKVKLDVIKSTTVHELVHWSVADSTQGFQNLAGGTDTILGLSSWSWDEVLTDYVAHKAYKSLKYGDYKTNYGNYLEFLDKICLALQQGTGWGFKSKKKAISEIYGLDEGMPEAEFKSWIGSTYKKKLFEEICFRYVKNNHATAAGGKCPANFKQYAEKTILPFATNLVLSEKTY